MASIVVSLCAAVFAIYVVKLLFDHPAIPATIFYTLVALIWWSGLKPNPGSTAELVFLFGKIFAWGLAVYLIVGWIGTAVNERRRTKESEAETIKAKETQLIKLQEARYKGHTEEFRRRAIEAEAQLKGRGLHGPVSDEEVNRRMDAAIAAHRTKTPKSQ